MDEWKKSEMTYTEVESWRQHEFKASVSLNSEIPLMPLLFDKDHDHEAHRVASEGGVMLPRRIPNTPATKCAKSSDTSLLKKKLVKSHSEAKCKRDPHLGLDFGIVDEPQAQQPKHILNCLVYSC